LVIFAHSDLFTVGLRLSIQIWGGFVPVFAEVW